MLHAWSGWLGFEAGRYIVLHTQELHMTVEDWQEGIEKAGKKLTGFPGGCKGYEKRTTAATSSRFLATAQAVRPPCQNPEELKVVHDSLMHGCKLQRQSSARRRSLKGMENGKHCDLEELFVL